VHDARAGDVIYVYLPLAHLFARMVQLTAFECGATLDYFCGDIRQVICGVGGSAPDAAAVGAAAVRESPAGCRTTRSHAVMLGDRRR
jgi:hypothetical protein